MPGYNMPGTIKAKENELKKRYGETMTNDLVKHSGGNVLAVLNESQATEIIKTIWPGAPAVEIKKAALVCAQYSLNPLMKHLFLIPFNTKVGDKWEKSYSMVLGIKASRIIARRHGEYGYLDDTPRIMTHDEQIKIFGEVDQLNICAITRLADRKGNSSIGTGRWPKDTAVKGTEKGNTKLNMAMIRSERQALDRLFPDSIPPEAADVVDERFMDEPKVTAEVVKPEVRQIEQPAEDEPEQVEQVEEQTEEKVEEKPAPAIKSLGDLYQACIKNYSEKFATSADVLKYIGKKQADIIDPAAEYAEIEKKLSAKAQ
jgi:hypothetical protein